VATPCTYAPEEIEAEIVSECWHAPERIAELRRAINPETHLLSPHLRRILEAIEHCYAQLGEVSFPTVVQALRETGCIEHAGGLDGVNEIYKIAAYDRDEERCTRIFTHEVAMLKTYAQNREQSPPSAPDFFTRGQVVLRWNKLKKNPSQPDATGEGSIASRHYRAAAWVEIGHGKEQVLRITLTPD
jgi:hypothetical protein